MYRTFSRKVRGFRVRHSLASRTIRLRSRQAMRFCRERAGGFDEVTAQGYVARPARSVRRNQYLNRCTRVLVGLILKGQAASGWLKGAAAGYQHPAGIPNASPTALIG